MYFKTVLVVCCSLLSLTAAQTQPCRVSSTLDEFRNYLKRFGKCRVTSAMTTFQDSVPILTDVYDDDGNFFKERIDYAKISSFCSRVSECKSVASTCEPDLQSFINNAGMALCQNGKALTKELKDAVDILASDKCNPEYDPVGQANDGCYASADTSMGSAYLSRIVRVNKITSAERRCLFRYMEKEKICTPKAVKALATLGAASEKLERIGVSYDSYTSYSTPSWGKERTFLAFRGFTHIYKDSEKIQTCKNLSESNVFLWNTYVRIGGTTSGLFPKSPAKLLTSITIQLSNSAGQVIDSYMTNSDDKVLEKQTLREKGGVKAGVKIEVVNDNLIVLSHPVIDTKIAVSKAGEGLSITIHMPTSLLTLESIGLLVDGCKVYNGALITDVKSMSSEECMENCSQSSIDAMHHDECAYDCSNKLKDYVKMYSSIRDQEDAAAGIVRANSATPTSSTVGFMILQTIAMILGTRYL